MRVSVVIPVFLVVGAARLAAQDAPALEIAGGYAFLHDQDSSYNFPAGWTLSLAWHTTPRFDAVVDGGGNYKTLSIPGDPPKFTVYSLMAGPRFRLGYARPISPFAQVLVGVARATTTVVGISETARDVAYQPGAGIDVALQRHLAARLAADYRVIRADGQNSKELRVVVAAVIGIGR